MTKLILSAPLAFIILFCLCGCISAEVPSIPPVSETPQITSPPPSVRPSTVSSPTPSPTPSPEPSPVKEPEKWEIIMAGMSLEEKVGQMFMAAYRKNQNGAITELDSAIEQSIREHHLGGVILFSENIVSIEQTKNYISSLKSLSEIPMFIGVDEEGGTVTRLSALDYPKTPSAGSMKTDDAYRYGSQIGMELAELGFTVNFAPVADLNTNPKNTVIGKRAFSSEPERASSMIRDFSRGLSENGIMPVVKHFPGHGDTLTDSHNGMASVTHNLDRIKSIEILPFLAGISEGAAVMVGHITTPEITGDNEPAIFSEFLLTGFLRGEYGYNGLLFTDAMDMGAVTKYYSSSEAAVKAIQAGIDIILMPQDLSEAYNAVLAAVENGDIPEERINESIERILKAKYPE